MLSYKKNSCRGAVLIETAICLPLLFIFFFGAMEVAQLQDFRQRASSVLAESLRAAATLPGLTKTSATNAPAFLSIQDKYKALMSDYHMTGSQFIDFYYIANDDGSAVVQGKIYVDVPESPLSGMFKIKKISVSGFTPYLAPS